LTLRAVAFVETSLFYAFVKVKVDKDNVSIKLMTFMDMI